MACEIRNGRVAGGLDTNHAQRSRMSTHPRELADARGLPLTRCTVTSSDASAVDQVHDDAMDEVNFKVVAAGVSITLRSSSD
ncbi:unnamed protein product [Heligmosomoides polygyrus]|uniref:Uncharacterized protein n=1 Tax=Heligmosomoides polygyrus TaxID=6339 RepID=A0A183GGZ1_HELPZ|nr:unnamed protein product [Heligmosomoides polygyrus]